MGAMELASTPDPPYYAVIFSSRRAAGDDQAYATTADRMVELARRQPGFLGVETAREAIGITVSYWTDEDAIAAWKRQAEHSVAQQRGRDRWYDAYELRIARVDRAYGFDRRSP